MFKNSRVGTVCFYISDPARTESFYRDVLGLEVVNMGDDGTGNDWLSAGTKGGLELIFFKMDGKAGGTPILVFELAEGGIDAKVAALGAAGATILTPVSDAPGGWSAEFADPDGHVLSMFQTEDLPR